MESGIVSKILRRINQPDLVSVLAKELSGTELNSLLLEVFQQKTLSMRAPQLLRQYEHNRFVQPVDLPVIELKRMELDILQLFERYSFEPLELSPISILGSCSVLGPASQNKILSALRGTEVLADSTNAIALHACNVKQKKEAKGEKIWMRYCNVQRQVRAQAVAFKGFKPHFRIGCLVTCGHDTGGFEFEKQSLHEHLTVMSDLFLNYYKVDDISFRLLRREGYSNIEILLQDTAESLHNLTGTRVTLVDKPATTNTYYKGIQYKADIRMNGKEYEIADGGFVDWTQQLLQDKKQRMLSSGFGFDLMYRILTREI